MARATHGATPRNVTLATSDGAVARTGLYHVFPPRLSSPFPAHTGPRKKFDTAETTGPSAALYFCTAPKVGQRRPDGQYAVTRPNADRASAITPTQGEAIERAGKIAPNAAIHVERIRNTNLGHPDKWRKP